MAQEQEEAVLTPAPARPLPRVAPLWNVVLLDDDEHTYDYVIEMLGRLFHHGAVNAYKLAREVDTSGRAIVETAVFERAEFKREQIHSYGADWRLERSHCSMRARLESVAG
ncbi:MAG: ATP-dependent Clp protease adaptor ClpS [Planctomycetes bacterium]|nr:ATP-dependent Clp protease adaptor ClpS [Planctomycetota bacterium]